MGNILISFFEALFKKGKQKPIELLILFTVIFATYSAKNYIERSVYEMQRNTNLLWVATQLSQRQMEQGFLRGYEQAKTLNYQQTLRLMELPKEIDALKTEAAMTLQLEYPRTIESVSSMYLFLSATRGK